MGTMDWVDEREIEIKESTGDDYFKFQEGDNRIQLLTHCAPHALRWTGSKYEPVSDGEKATSIKGVCFVLQDGVIKLAQLPYTVVKAIKSLMEDPDYAFDSFPMPRMINIKAKGAGTVDVEYSVIPSPKEAPVAPQTLTELALKPTPEGVVEKLRGKLSQSKKIDYPEGEVNPSDVPFN